MLGEPAIVRLADQNAVDILIRELKLGVVIETVGVEGITTHEPTGAETGERGTGNPDGPVITREATS